MWNDNIRNTGLLHTYTNFSGSGIDMTLSIDDPANRNEEHDNPLVNLPTGDANGDPPVFAKTDEAYGNEYLTLVVNSADSDKIVIFTLDYSAPVFVQNCSIGDVDYIGNNTPNNAAPHDSFQDEILLSAQRSGSPVGFTGTTGTAGSPVITLNNPANGQFAAAGGPYNNNVNGNPAPANAAGTAYLATLEPVTSISFAYSEGPDDAQGDATNLAGAGGTWLAANWAPALTNTDTGVPNKHAARVNQFTVCVGNMTMGDTVFADDSSGTINPTTTSVADTDFGLQPSLGTVDGAVFADRGKDGSLDGPAVTPAWAE